MSERRRIDPDRVARARAVDLAGLVGRAVKLRRKGRRYEGLCPFHSERTPSFGILPNGAAYHCFGCGAHGDAIDWVQWRDGCAFGEAVDALLGDGGPREPDSRARPAVPAKPLPAPEAGRETRRQTRALRIWREAVACGPVGEVSPAEVYISKARGIDLEAVGWPIPSLRCHPALDYWHAGAEQPVSLGKWPAMVAGVQAPDGRVVAVHVTYLAPDGHAKAEVTAPDGEALPAKKMQGGVQGCAVRLSPASDVGLWAVAEGIETALSVLWAERAAGRDTCVWAALSLGNLHGGGLGRGPRHPRPRRRGDRLPSAEPDPERPGVLPPPGVTSALICADGDGKDPIAQQYLEARAAARFRAAGAGEVLVAKPPPGKDFNDLVKEGA